MDAIEAIEGRRSVRAFRPDPIPRDILEKIMRAALKAPSWENTQPWEFAVVCGEAMTKLRAAVSEKMESGEKPDLDIPWPKFTGAHHERSRALGKRLLPELGMEKGDMANWWISMTQFFYAPCGVIAFMDSYLGEWSILDMGMALENLMIAAAHFGIGTCAISAGVIYPDLLRNLLEIPDSKRIIIALAMGYPDLSSPAATFRSDKEPPEMLVSWHGFD
ncbi:MAG: nitroreductase [Dehalococcoidia bacterium]